MTTCPNCGHRFDARRNDMDRETRSIKAGNDWKVLSPIEWRIFECLRDQRLAVSLDALYQTIYPDRKSRKWTLHTHLSNLRQKLVGTAFSLRTAGHHGYFIDETKADNPRSVPQ